MTQEKTVEKKLSRAAIETLAIIVYHQPVTRAEIEEIRGVAFGTNTLEILMELDWVKPGGRKDVPRSEEHTSELQSRLHLVCRLLLEKKTKYTPKT